MIVHMTMEVTLTLPDGSASMDMTGGRGWVLPNGDFVKAYATLELNDADDLSYIETLKIGCDINDMIIESEIVEDAQ